MDDFKMTSAINTYVFDAYGTLFDVHSAVERYEARIGAHAREMSELWRSRQVEYSWTYSLMGRKSNFWQLTQLALDYSMARFGLSDDALRADLMNAYLQLHAYPEVPHVLRTLKERGARVIILSNGTEPMVRSAVRSAGLEEWVDNILSVDEVEIFKPHPRVYELVAHTLDISPDAVSFQSCNPWDAAGAASYGFRVVWINRKGLPAEYPLAGARREVRSLHGLADIWNVDHV
jgi:2-haloacid dehalogenase